jgi:hypothetical protein
VVVTAGAAATGTLVLATDGVTGRWAVPRVVDAHPVIRAADATVTARARVAATLRPVTARF